MGSDHFAFITNGLSYPPPMGFATGRIAGRSRLLQKPAPMRRVAVGGGSVPRSLGCGDAGLGRQQPGGASPRQHVR